jgi:hypothetical protein
LRKVGVYYPRLWRTPPVYPTVNVTLTGPLFCQLARTVLASPRPLPPRRRVPLLLREPCSLQKKLTSRPKDREYRAPKGGPLKISKVTAKLTEALKSRIVKQLGSDVDSAAYATYTPMFEGGEEMEVRVVPGWRLGLKNTLTVCQENCQLPARNDH